MNKIFIVVALSGLSFLSISADKESDYIKKQIKKGQSGAIKAYIKGNISVTAEHKKEYLALARELVAKKKEDIGATPSFNGVSGIDLGLVTVGSLILIAGLPKFKNEVKAAKGLWETGALDNGQKFDMFCSLTVGALTIIKGGMSIYKDMQKKDKRWDKLESAEKVLRAVEALPVK